MKQIPNPKPSHWLALIFPLFFLSAVILGSGCTAGLSPTPGSSTLPAQDSQRQAQDYLAGQEPALLLSALSDLPDLSRVPRYTIDLAVDPEQLTYQGQLHLDYTNQEDVPLDELYFRLLPNGDAAFGNGELVVDQVSLDGSQLEHILSLDDSVMRLGLPGPVSPGESTSIEMSFSGKIPGNLDGNEIASGYGIFNAAAGVISLSGWFPMLAVYDQDGWNLDPVSSIGDSVFSDIAFYDVAITIPDDMTLAATGVQTGRTRESGTQTLKYASGPVRDFYLVMSDQFQQKSNRVEDVTVTLYTLPGHRQADREALSLASASLETFNQAFGEYPYRELDLVGVPLRYATGVEFPGIILIRDDEFEDPADPTFQVVITHEVAHQWWYNLVGSDVFDHPWQDEALVTYSSMLPFESSGNQAMVDGLNQYWLDNYQNVVDKNGEERVTESLAYFEGSTEPGTYGGIVYSRGALFFAALRQEIGDEAFFQALQEYLQAYRYQVAYPQDLLGAFERAAGRSLGDFYNKWLYTP
jgi:hypothetical protein